MNGRPWTTDDLAQLRRLTAAGMTHAEIGEQMGRRRDQVCRKCKEHGIRPGISAKAKAIIARLSLRRIRAA